MATQLETRLSDPELETEEPIFSHIVGGDENETSEAKVMRARVDGTPITAICGYTWVPSRDPMKHPICPRCKAIIKSVGHGNQN